MTGSSADTGLVMVRQALDAMRFSTAQVHGVVAHVVDPDPAASSLVLQPHWLVGELRGLHPPISSLECVRTTVPGAALEVLTYLRQEYGPRAREVRMQEPDAHGWRTTFQVQRVPEPRDDDPVTFEYLLEVPDEYDPRWPERPTVGLAALLLIEFVTAKSFDISFIHAPASPPALRGQPCLPHGPCARVGVAVPRRRAPEMLGLGTDLVEQVSGAGLHLWVRDTETPGATYDAWRRMYPSSHTEGGSPGASGPPPSDAPDATRLAITCIGPARRGVTAQLARRFAAAQTRVWAVTAVKLDELMVAHGVVDAKSLPDPPSSSGVGALHALLGVDDGNNELAGFRAFWSTLEPPPAPPVPPVPPAERRVLWLKWSVRTTHQLSPNVVASAWTAVRDACQRWAPGTPTPDPRVDYVISRVRAGGLLQGRAKIVLGLGAVKHHWPEGTDDGHWLRRFCAEIEDRWRTDLHASLRPRRADLVVGWSESWLARRPPLRR